MNTTNRFRRATTRLVTRVLLFVGAIGVIASPAAAGMGGGWEPTVGHLTRTIAHTVGIVGGLIIVYYADQIRRNTSGSTMGKSSLLVELGTMLFVLVFLGMEAQHALGIDLWYFTAIGDVTKLWWMLTLVAMLALYTMAYRTMAMEIGG